MKYGERKMRLSSFAYFHVTGHVMVDPHRRVHTVYSRVHGCEHDVPPMILGWVNDLLLRRIIRAVKAGALKSKGTSSSFPVDICSVIFHDVLHGYH